MTPSANIIKSLNLTISRLALNLQESISINSEREFSSPAVKNFLGFTNKFCDHVIDRMEEYAQEPPSDLRRMGVAIRELCDIYLCLSFLHQVSCGVNKITPTEIPSPLLFCLAEKLENIFPDSKLIIKQCSAYNYLTNFRLDIIKGKLPLEYQEEADKFAILEYPFSEMCNIFQPCLLLHETGHFIYRRKKIWDFVKNTPIFNELERLVTSEASKESKDNMFRLTSYRIKAWNISKSWLEEIFCDMVATRIGGPAYLYSFVFHFNPEFYLPEKTPNQTHPPLPFRIRAILEVIKKADNDWAQIISLETNYLWELINDIARRPFHPDSNEPEFNTAGKVYEMVFPMLRDKAFEKTENIYLKVEEFQDIDDKVTDALKNLIPPLPTDGMFAKDVILCNPFALISSAFIFYISRLGFWLGDFRKSKGFEDPEKSETLKDYSELYDILNRLVYKALEDLLIVRRARELGEKQNVNPQ